MICSQKGLLSVHTMFLASHIAEQFSKTAEIISSSSLNEEDVDQSIIQIQILGVFLNGNGHMKLFH